MKKLRKCSKRKIIHKYSAFGIKNRSNNWIELETWLYKNLKGCTVNVYDVGENDYGDYKALVEIGKNKEL